jgi:ankyrin repeat protein
VARLLLENGAEPNVQDASGTTALMEAVSSGHNELIEALISHRADPALQDREGHTAADLARSRGNQEAVALLGAGT